MASKGTQTSNLKLGGPYARIPSSPVPPTPPPPPTPAGYVYVG